MRLVTNSDKVRDFISRIQAINGTPVFNFTHLVEEVGEISTELQIELGDRRKKSGEGVLYEAVDAMICALALAIGAVPEGQDAYEVIAAAADKKLAKWEANFSKGLCGDVSNTDKSDKAGA